MKLRDEGLIERLISSKKVYFGKLFDVKRDEVQLPSRYKAVREVVEHPGAVAVVPMLKENAVLMIKQYRHAAGRVLLEIPAGTLNKDESPEECARREMVEETGYYPENLVKLTQCYLAPGYSNEVIHIYLTSKLIKRRRRRKSDEIIEVERLKLNDALLMIKEGKIIDSKTICGLLLSAL